MLPVALSSSPLRRLLAALFTLVVLASACSSGNDEATDSSGGAPAVDVATDDNAEFEEAADGEMAEDRDTGGDAAAPDAAGSGGLSDAAAVQPVDTGRDIIFTAVVGVEVEDVVVASQEAVTAIQGLGGILFGQVTTTDGVPRTTLTFKVPPEDFQVALARLGEIGFLRDQQITATDVTERIVDIESQIITSELSVERLRGFLAEATTLTDIAEIERQLLERETNLELLRGQLRTLENQVGLATITVTFTQQEPGPEFELEQTAYLGHDDGTTCPGFEELEGDEGEDITICYVIRNTGDTLLGEIDVRDDGLDLDLKDLRVVAGSLDEPLAVGASVTLAAEISAEPFTNGRAQATAIAVAEDGTDLRLGAVAARDELDLMINEDTSLPGFLDGLDAGVDVVVSIVDVIVVSAGFLLPFIWVIPLVWWLLRWRKRRSAAKAEADRARLANIPPPTPPVDETTAEPTADVVD